MRKYRNKIWLHKYPSIKDSSDIEFTACYKAIWCQGKRWHHLPYLTHIAGRSRIEYLTPTNNIIVLDSYFNLTNKFHLIIRFFDQLVVATFWATLYILLNAHCLVVGLGLWLDLVSGSLVVMHTYLYHRPLPLSLILPCLIIIDVPSRPNAETSARQLVQSFRCERGLTDARFIVLRWLSADWPAGWSVLVRCRL